jgi:hypothetical protein
MGGHMPHQSDFVAAHFQAVTGKKSVFRKISSASSYIFIQLQIRFIARFVKNKSPTDTRRCLKSAILTEIVSVFERFCARSCDILRILSAGA